MLKEHAMLCWRGKVYCLLPVCVTVGVPAGWAPYGFGACSLLVVIKRVPFLGNCLSAGWLAAAGVSFD